MEPDFTKGAYVTIDQKALGDANYKEGDTVMVFGTASGSKTYRTAKFSERSYPYIVADRMSAVQQ